MRGRRSGSGLVATVAVGLAAGSLAAARAEAQMPGQPVLQNAWSNPGITVAGNYGSGNGERGFGAAGAWAPGSGRFQVSLGIGALTPDTGSTTFSGGVRVMAPLPFLPRDGSFGAAAFVGAGGARPNGGTVARVPVGLAAGYRRAIGETRGVSLYLTPFYGWSRASADGASASDGVVRVSVGADVALTRQMGVSVGYEMGQKAKDGNPGPTGNVFGVGVSYVLGRP